MAKSSGLILGMNPRYPAPMADKIWSEEARAHRMRVICDAYAEDANERGLLGIEIPDPEVFAKAGPVDIGGWGEAEAKYGHEIVAFLDVYLQRLPEQVHPLVHYGLTSSDLVEYDLHKALAEHSAAMAVSIKVLERRLLDKGKEFPLERAGRTHGQTAELTRLDHQFSVHASVFARIAAEFQHIFTVIPMKMSGPVGMSPIRQTVLPTNRAYPVPSTQIIPRDYLLAWAALHLRLANALDSLATFVRLGCRSEIGEFAEGASKRRVGSSAMPGKRNPIQSEQVCGLARVARGHFLALAEVSNLWEDRDLSNSSTERVCVPGLASTTEYMTGAMYRVIDELEINASSIGVNSMDARTSANDRQNAIQRRDRVGPIEASRRAT